MPVNYTKLYTKAGDGGKTSLFDGTKVSKGEPVIELLCTLDRLNHDIGGAHLVTDDSDISLIQRILFNLMGNVAGGDFFQEDDLNWLLKRIDEVAQSLDSSQSGWVVYGESKDSISYMYDGFSITVREAECKYHQFVREKDIDKTISKFLNALSKLFYLKARRKNVC